MLRIPKVTGILLEEAFTYLAYEIDLSLQENIKLNADPKGH